VRAVDRRRLDPSTVLPANAPLFVRDVDARLERLYTQPHRFAELVGRNLVDKDDRLRARRDDRRANWVKVTRVYGRRIDRRTLRCGAPRFDKHDTIDAPSVEETASEAGVSVSTVKRINAELAAAGLVDSYRVVMEYVDGNGFCGLPSVRRFTPKFLRQLGFTDAKVSRAQASGSAQWRRKTGRSISPAAVQKARAARADVGKAFQATPRAPAAWPPDEDGIEWTLERLRLREEHPDWGLERIVAEARRNLRP
jgi:AraC-like DNA-binding protein